MTATTETLTPKQKVNIPPATDNMTIPKMYAYRADRYPGSVAAQQRTSIGGWKDVTIEELLADAEVEKLYSERN